MADLEHQAMAGMNESGQWEVMIHLKGYTDEADAKSFATDYNDCGQIYFVDTIFTPEQGKSQ